MVLKVQHKKAIYVYAKEKTYEKLVEFVLETFPVYEEPEEFELFYLDEDQDEITISCEKDLHCFLDSSPKNTKIQVKKVEKSRRMSQVSQADSLMDELRCLSQSFNSSKPNIEDDEQIQIEEKLNKQENLYDSFRNSLSQIQCTDQLDKMTSCSSILGSAYETNEKQVQCSQQDIQKSENQNQNQQQQKLSNINSLMQQRLKNAEEMRRRKSDQQLELFTQNKDQYYHLITKNQEFSDLFKKLQSELKLAMPEIQQFLEFDFSHKQDEQQEYQYNENEKKILKEINLHKCLKLQQISTTCGKNQLIIEKELKKQKTDQQNLPNQTDQTVQAESQKDQKFVKAANKVIKENREKNQNKKSAKKGGNIFQKFIQTLTKKNSKAKNNLKPKTSQLKKKSEKVDSQNQNKKNQDAQDPENKSQAKVQESQNEQNQKQKQENQSNEVQMDENHQKEQNEQNNGNQDNSYQEQKQEQEENVEESEQQQQQLQQSEYQEQNFEQAQKIDEPQVELTKEQIRKQKEQEQFQFKLVTYGEQLSEVLGGSPESYYGIIMKFPMAPIEDLIENIIENPGQLQENQL